MTATWSIITGVVSGIITSGLLLILTKIFDKIVIPWYQALIYKGINIEGTWFIYFDHPQVKKIKKSENTATITQKGHKITGEIILTMQPNGDKLTESKILVLNGCFSNNDLILSYECKDNRRIGAGTYVMKLAEDGNKLKGISTYVNSIAADIVSLPQIWIRKR